MSRRKGGRPNKEALAERKRRAKAAASEAEHRRWMEAQIKQGLVRVLSPAEWLAADDNDSLEDALIEAPKLSPCMQFVVDKLKKLERKRVDLDDTIVCRVFLDLLLTDLPLDKRARISIHEAALRLTEPASVRQKREDCIKLGAILMDTEALERRGFYVDGVRMAPEEAHEWLADQHGFRHYDAMRKWIASRRHLIREARQLFEAIK